MRYPIQLKKVAIGTAGYTVCTFALAVLWHVVLFENQYQAFGYFEGEPSFVTGFVTILLQGIILSVLFPLVSLNGSAIVRGLKFAALIGLFFWTSHVLAFVAKQIVQQTISFMMMETVYLILQFGVFGVLIGLIYRHEDGT